MDEKGKVSDGKSTKCHTCSRFIIVMPYQTVKTEAAIT